jgi:hypothetical protein
VVPRLGKLPETWKISEKDPTGIFVRGQQQEEGPKRQSEAEAEHWKGRRGRLLVVRDLEESDSTLQKS